VGWLRLLDEQVCDLRATGNRFDRRWVRALNDQLPELVPPARFRLRDLAARLISFFAAASDPPATLGTTHFACVWVWVLVFAGGVCALGLHCAVVPTHTLLVPWLLAWAISPL
jgi:hypothetical protein